MTQAAIESFFPSFWPLSSTVVEEIDSDYLFVPFVRHKQKVRRVIGMRAAALALVNNGQSLVHSR